MSSFLVDTDVLISYTKRIPGAASLLRRVVEDEDQAVPAISAITVFELLQGLRAPEKPAIRRLVGTFRCLPMTQPIAHAAAALAREARYQGRRVPVGDAVIAATAVLHDLVLVTGNRKHFEPLGVRLLAEHDPADEG